MTILKHGDVIKKLLDLDYYFGVFWKILCSTTLMQSFTGLNWFRIYGEVRREGGGRLSTPPPPQRLFNLQIDICSK